MILLFPSGELSSSPELSVRDSMGDYGSKDDFLRISFSYISSYILAISLASRSLSLRSKQFLSHLSNSICPYLVRSAPKAQIRANMKKLSTQSSLCLIEFSSNKSSSLQRYSGGLTLV